MALLWRAQFSVGNDLIDADHKYLIDIINKAERSLQANNRVELTAVLTELAHYGASHFDREERVAKAVGYLQADQLHVSHGKLVAALDKFKQDVGDTWTPETVTHFTGFLRDWLIQHVIKEDMLMKPWMLKHSPRFDPRS